MIFVKLFPKMSLICHLGEEGAPDHTEALKYTCNISTTYLVDDFVMFLSCC